METCLICPFLRPKAELVAKYFCINDIFRLTDFPKSLVFTNEMFLFSQMSYTKGLRYIKNIKI